MKPNLRLQSIAFIVTTAFIYFLWTYISKFLIENPKLAIPLGGLIALGSYRLVINGFIELLKIEFLKKKIFGKYYMNGTWVGCYLGVNGEPVYYIEEYEQDFEDLIIRGRAYFSNGAFKGCWVSDNVTLDIPKGKIVYTYQTDMLHNSFVSPGQAVFNIIRENGNKAPTHLIGYSTDVHVKDKYKSLEVKTYKNKHETDNDLILKAKRLFEQNKDFFASYDRESKNVQNAIESSPVRLEITIKNYYMTSNRLQSVPRRLIRRMR